MTQEQAVEIVLSELKPLGAYIFHKAKTDSVYVKFEDKRIGSLRIGDHDGREKYKYRWNLRSDMVTERVIKDNHVRRFYFPINKTYTLCKAIKGYADAIKRGDEFTNNYMLDPELFNPIILEKMKANVPMIHRREINKALLNIHACNILLGITRVVSSNDVKEITNSIVEANLYTALPERIEEIVKFYLSDLIGEGLVDEEGFVQDEGKQMVAFYLDVIEN